MIITIRIPGNVDRIIESSKINFNKKKKIDLVLPISAVENKLNNDNNSNGRREEFSKNLENEIQKIKKR